MLSITEILTAVHLLQLTVVEAEPLIQQHIDAAVAAAADRNEFAKAAMNGMLATGIRYSTGEVLAAKCFLLADSMVAAARRELTAETVATARDML